MTLKKRTYSVQQEWTVWTYKKVVASSRREALDIARESGFTDDLLPNADISHNIDGEVHLIEENNRKG